MFDPDATGRHTRSTRGGVSASGYPCWLNGSWLLAPGDVLRHVVRGVPPADAPFKVAPTGDTNSLGSSDS